MFGTSIFERWQVSTFRWHICGKHVRRNDLVRAASIWNVLIRLSDFHRTTRDAYALSRAAPPLTDENHHCRHVITTCTCTVAHQRVEPTG